MGGMKLDSICIREAPHETESLAVALRSVAAAAGVTFDYDDLCAALGVSFTAVSVGSEPSPGWWTTYGRDAFLTPAARLFGLHVRDLHPPEVAIELTTAEEFDQHWELSYKPHIQQALRNGQPVLAWQGWPEARWPFWGVITSERGGKLTGCTIWSEGQPVELVEPALQCYVVEVAEPFQPQRDRLLATALAHANAYINGAPYACGVPGAAAPPIITGPSAFDAWETWLASDAAIEAAGGGAWNEHRQHAEFIATARASAERFLARMQEVAGAAHAETLARAIESARDVQRWLARSRDASIARAAFAQRRERETLLEDIKAAEAADRRLAMAIEELAAAFQA